MKDASQNPLRLMPAPETATVELLYRTFGDVLIPLEKLRVQYFRNLNEQTFASDLETARIPLSPITLKDSRKSLKYIHIRHLAAWIDTRAYLADEELAKKQNASNEQND